MVSEHLVESVRGRETYWNYETCTKDGSLDSNNDHVSFALSNFLSALLSPIGGE